MVICPTNLRKWTNNLVIFAKNGIHVDSGEKVKCMQEVSMMSKPILEMKHIRKCFSSTVALDDVDLNVYPGEIRGLIGENGSGTRVTLS